jgi:hypothetical protein
VRKGKPGSKGKTSKKPGLEVEKELNIYDEMAEQVLEKYNMNHDMRGRFAATGRGAGGGGAVTAPAAGGGASSDLPPWMDAKPKQTTVTAPVEEKPGYKPWKKLPDNTYLPDSDGKYPYPDAPKARLDLKPFVGQEKPMEYWAENIGGKSFTNPNLKTRCIRDVKVQGVKAPVAHVWAQQPSSELMAAKWGQEQKAIGVVTAYAKGKHGEPKKMDYSIQPVRGTVNKEAPLLDADMIIETLGHLILEKYNRNHDARGRFAATSGGAGGGGVISLEEALADENAVPKEPQNNYIEVTDGEVVGVIDNQLGIPDEQALEITREIDGIAANAKLQEMHQVTFKELAPQVLAQCEGEWGQENGKTVFKEVIAVNPHAKDYATSRYVEDHMQLQATGKMPWLASANADDANKAYKAVLVHEVAHAKMMEHSLKSPTGLHNENNPMQGTKTWARLVNEAHTEGWQGPSLYGRKNLGECFAESVSLLTIRGSTGSKKIDDYVVRVITE